DNVLVLGGLISDEQNESREKVPILGDLPLIGKLFSGRSSNRAKRNLMVFIHPVILKEEPQMATITRAHYEYMRQQQEDARQRPPTTTEKDQAPATLEDFDVFSPVRRAPQ